MIAPAVLTLLLRAGGLWLVPVGHPLHSALAEIEYQPTRESVLIRIRAFTDDLVAAVSSLDDSASSDSTLSGYVRSRLVLRDSAGRSLALQWQGARQSGDVTLLELRAKLTGGLRRCRILPALFWERFPDQVNIVRASYEGGTVTLLFTPGDPAKTLP